jgi:hypothetical protein
MFEAIRNLVLWRYVGHERAVMIDSDNLASIANIHQRIGREDDEIGGVAVLDEAYTHL